jgi:branched-chain amino acid transport system substrate-binding protein
MAPILAEAARGNPEAFVACSYPPDTRTITEQARVSGFNPKVFYTGVGTAFPLYRQRFGANAEGVMGMRRRGRGEPALPGRQAPPPRGLGAGV